MNELHALAAHYGVATSYEDWRRREVAVGDDTVRAVLGAMGVDATTPEAIRDALAEAELQRWRRALPGTVVACENRTTEVIVRVPAGVADPAVEVRLADGTSRALTLEQGEHREREVDGRRLVERHLVLPADLPRGEHTLAVASDAGAGTAHLFVVPHRLGTADDLPRTWGWMVQLYALRSERSWGIGDLGDLRELSTWSARAHGSDFVLVNPLHAAAPTLPRQNSPYYPTSRRFHDPMIIDVEALQRHTALDEDTGRRIDELAARVRSTNTTDRIDRDRAFVARQEALELLFAADSDAERRAGFTAFRTRGGQALEDFATWCVLAELNDGPWGEWPAELRDPRGPQVQAVRREHADRVTYHAWLQWCCDVQLAATQQAARDAGARVGIIHDLAVGVDPGGADAWALQDVLAGSATIGAPPDEFNRRGQDWRLPPLRPDRLAETGYRAFREILAATLRHSGGVRIDHALGLFRLYWIPEGAGAADGTYVTYPAQDLLGILALDAAEAGAVVVAEDLGTVPEGTTEALHDHGFFGSEVLYFARDDDDEPLQADDYDPLTFASVTTHDLPTAAGWWASEAPRVQARLGQLGDQTTLEQALEESAEQQGMMRELLAKHGVIGEHPDRDELVLAMYRFLARTPALLVAAWLPDAVGDLRQPNLPGTTDAYPNWRMPIAEAPAEGGGPRPVLLEDLRGDPRVERLVRAVRRP